MKTIEAIDILKKFHDSSPLKRYADFCIKPTDFQADGVPAPEFANSQKLRLAIADAIVALEGKAIYEAYDGSKLDKADRYIEKLEKALHLSCVDAADDCCPHELYDYDTEKCGDCPHDGEIHQDTERDVACWKNYYLQEAYKEIMSNR